MSTQLKAQMALTAHMATQRGKLPSGAAVTLLWLRSYLHPVTFDLLHEYQAFGFDARGKYVSETVQDASLRDIVYLNKL